MLPIPRSQLHYADPAVNDESQSVPITAFVDRVQYPTLGCPALLTADKPLSVLVSLPAGETPESVSLALVDRHNSGAVLPLAVAAAVETLDAGPAGKTGHRVLYQLTVSLEGKAPALYDLRVRTASVEETQANAVRIYAQITGSERVLYCGDPQFNVDNAICLERWIDRVNALTGIAWIAVIGDICDNGVMTPANLIKLAAGAKAGRVRAYYSDEFPGARARLARLNKPVVLMPGNHDGMVAYDDYSIGVPTNVVVGPDPRNAVAYDGLHHYRRTFGPLYFGFDWHKTRYLATNTFELERHQRLGYHAIVTNWGGWMQRPQVDWLAQELALATSQGQHKVLLCHHDPRGGNAGKKLGVYSAYRPFDFEGVGDIMAAYVRYIIGHIGTFQQEWMRWKDVQIGMNPVREVLSMLLEHKVWAVVMGHDNENWIESYSEGSDIFRVKPRRVDYPAAAGVDPIATRDARDLLKARELQALDELLSSKPAGEAGAILEQAVELLEAKGYFEPAVAFAPDEIEAWNLRAKAPIHFAHVDDVGAYKHSGDSDFKAYGYVVAQLEQGRPISVQRFDVLGTSGNTEPLLEG